MSANTIASRQLDTEAEDMWEHLLEWMHQEQGQSKDTQSEQVECVSQL